MCGILSSDTQASIKIMVVRRVDLQDDVLTGRARVATEGREVVRLHCRFSFMLQQTLSQRTQHHLRRQRVASVGTAQQHAVLEVAEAPSGLSPQ